MEITTDPTPVFVPRFPVNRILELIRLAMREDPKFREGLESIIRPYDLELRLVDTKLTEHEFSISLELRAPPSYRVAIPILNGGNKLRIQVHERPSVGLDFALPTDLDGDLAHAGATLRNGVLDIVIPRRGNA